MFHVIVMSMTMSMSTTMFLPTDLPISMSMFLPQISQNFLLENRVDLTQDRGDHRILGETVMTLVQ